MKNNDLLEDVINADCGFECPVQKSASILDGKWTTLIIRELLTGKKRYSQLQKGLGGISPKLLSARLKLLQQHDLITKKIYPTIPPKTEYQLTDLGMELKHVIGAMAKFGLKL